MHKGNSSIAGCSHIPYTAYVHCYNALILCTSLGLKLWYSMHEPRNQAIPCFGPGPGTRLQLVTVVYSMLYIASVHINIVHVYMHACTCDTASMHACTCDTASMHACTCT